MLASLWKELAKTALLGVDRAALPDSLKRFLQQQGLEGNSVNATKQLLSAVAVLHPMRKAGFALRRYQGPFPDLPAAETTPFPAELAELLPSLLNGSYAAALPEFLGLLHSHGLTLPPAHLPALLEQPVIREFWSLIEPLIDGSGQWLLQQNPSWRTFTRQTDRNSWETGTAEERATFLRNLRRADPTAAREILAETWSKEKTSDKIAFLLRLKDGLSKNDLPLLEEAHADRSQSVRQAAAFLLLQIPESTLSIEAHSEARRYFQWRAGRVKIGLPAETPPTVLATGAHKRSRPAQVGERTFWLQELLAQVDPRLWQAQEGSAVDRLESLLREPDGAPLIEPLIRASILFRREDWALAALDLWLREPGFPELKKATQRKLLALADKPLLCEHLLEAVRRRRGLLLENSPAYQLLTLEPFPWENALSLALLRRLQAHLSEQNGLSWEGWHYRAILQIAGFSIDPALLARVGSGWPQEAANWGMWEESVEYFLRTLQFRRHFHRLFMNIAP